MIFLTHFAVALAAGIGLFWLFFSAAQEESTSAPFGLVFLAVAAGTLAQMLSPWATPLVLYLHFLAGLREHLADSIAPDPAGRRGKPLT